MIRYKVLDPEQYYLLDRFYEGAAIPRPDPTFSRVFAAIDESIGQIIGFITLQLVAHAEPIYIDPAYREMGVWSTLCAMLDANAIGSGLVGIYTQPTTPKTKHMCESFGFHEMEHPLFCKIYDSRFEGMLPPGPIDEDARSIALEPVPQ